MKLHIYETGAASDPAILFLHASPLSGRMWQPQFEQLTGYQCLAPDLPGHGQSASVVPLVVRDTAQYLADVIRERTPNGKAHVVGLSFGGVIAQALMVVAPEVVDHAILSGTGMRMSKSLIAIERLNEPLLRLLRPEQLAALVALQFGIPSRYRDVLRDDFKAFSVDVFMQVLEAYPTIETPSSTASPTLVAVGQKETFIAKQIARRLSRAIPGARGVMIPKMGHVWNLQAPDLFTDTVRAWVTDHPLPDTLIPL
jgi:pimeloyl-ACP methyl ester carboxylesterase